MIEDPEPKDTLDAMTATTENLVTSGVANGPEDIDLDWAQIDWRQVEGGVRRLRQRIFTASRASTATPAGACLSRVPRKWHARF